MTASSPDENPLRNDEAARAALQPTSAASALHKAVTPRQSELNTAPLRRHAVASTRGATSIGPRWRSAARSIGVACFILGAALLLYVFSHVLEGFQHFSDPGYLSKQIRLVQGDGWGEAILAPVIAIGTEFIKLGYLLALAFLGSIVMAKGIQFFAASESVIDEALEDEL